MKVGQVLFSLVLNHELVLDHEVALDALGLFL